MSSSQKRHRSGSVSRIQPSILRSRKRKTCENEEEKTDKQSRREPNSEMIARPLEDVTSSLNVEREGSTTPDSTLPEAWNRFRGLTCFPTPTSLRRVPLPNFSWANKNDVWELMCRKDTRYKRSPDHLSRHPALHLRMRAILLDWITEVCEVYKLHRETYYLSVDYVDRYLAASYGIPKQQLQLIGVTCLFIATKIEEIYPPKLSEFAYVTDGACTETEILDKELVILKTLNWDLSPVTPNCWLNTFLQLLSEIMENRSSFEFPESRDEHKFIFPNYSGLTFVQVARLLDLCTLDTSSLAFTSSKLAASALCYLVSPQLAAHVSGYSVPDLQDCYDWMGAFAITVRDMGMAPLKSFNSVSVDDLHNIQTHSVDLEALEKAQMRLSQTGSAWRRSPPAPQILTPPKTDEKSRLPIAEDS